MRGHSFVWTFFWSSYIAFIIQLCEVLTVSSYTVTLYHNNIAMGPVNWPSSATREYHDDLAPLPYHTPSNPHNPTHDQHLIQPIIYRTYLYRPIRTDVQQVPHDIDVSPIRGEMERRQSLERPSTRVHRSLSREDSPSSLVRLSIPGRVRIRVLVYRGLLRKRHRVSVGSHFSRSLHQPNAGEEGAEKVTYSV